MRSNGAVSIAVLAAAVLAAACGAEEPVPATPTWVEDVEPIVRGQCSHCHGATAKSFARADALSPTRRDVYDAMAFDEFGPFDPAVQGAKDWATLVPFVEFKTPNRMPPPPATPLSEREIKVLKRWFEKGAPRGMRARNAKPAVSWIVKGKTFEVADGDGEQVLGKITCGAATGQILHAGAQGLPMGATSPCMVVLHDGQDRVTAALSW